MGIRDYFEDKEAQESGRERWEDDAKEHDHLYKKHLPYTSYLSKNRGIVKTKHFLDDFDPIGLRVIAEMEKDGIAKRMVDAHNKIDDLMLIYLEQWRMWR